MNSNSIAPRKILIHAVCWMLFISYEVGVSWYFGEHSTIFEYACFYVLDILFFYFNAHFVFFKFTPSGSFSRYIILIVAILSELTIYTYISTTLNNAFMQMRDFQVFTSIKTPVLIMSVSRGVYFLGLSIAYWAVLRTIKAVKTSQNAQLNQLRSLRENERLEKDILKLNNSYLQARINPHFLFNTLNFIFNQVEEGDPDASKNIHLLSDIMRYSLSIEEDGKVPLYQEIDHIKRYIKLNKSRFDNRLYLEDQITEISGGDARIPPLLLLTFVENVFKHGDMTDVASPGIISISYKDGKLLLYTKNKKKKSRMNHGEHVGIINAITRLKNYYTKDDFDLEMKDEEAEFILNLKIQIWN